MAEAEAYEDALMRGRRHVRSRAEFSTIHALELTDSLPRLNASSPPPERGPPQRVQCRYLDAGLPDPTGDAPGARPSVAATWTCALPGGPLIAARWTFDFNRPDTWPTRLRVDAPAAGAPPLIDLPLTARFADAMVRHPSSAPQIDTPLSHAAATTLLVRTWGARAPRSTPPFWLEVWSGTP
jgi:hypothetical protein